MSSMAWSLDTRIPVDFVTSGDEAGNRAVIVEGEQVITAGRVSARFAVGPAGHAPGCACCGAHSPVAAAFASLFLAHARGEIPPLSGVAVLAVTDAGRSSVRAALEGDRLLQARFRLVS